MSEEFTYSTYEVDQIVAKKDGEIARLKEVVETLDIEIGGLKEDFEKARQWNQLCELQIRNLQSVVEDQDKLITELADALTSQDRPETPPFLREDHELIQRAREAVK